MISQPCQELEDPVIVSLGVNVDVPLVFKGWGAPGIQRDVSKASPDLFPGLEVCSLDCRPSWWPPPKTCAAFDHTRQRCRLQWSGEQRPSLKRGIQYPSQYPLSGEEESCLIGQLGDHVGVVRVGKVEAPVAVREVLQYQMFVQLTPRPMFSPPSADSCPWSQESSLQKLLPQRWLGQG